MDSALWHSIGRSVIFLRDRKESFVTAGYQTRYVSCGVPQGSCLGPLLFSIFISYLSLLVNNSNMVMYADDTTLYRYASNKQELATVLNQDLERVSDWVKVNKLEHF